MATVNFSVPEEVKQAFNTTFDGQNKSAVIAELMREAVERAQRGERHRAAIGRILGGHVAAPKVSEAQFKAARKAGRG